LYWSITDGTSVATETQLAMVVNEIDDFEKKAMLKYFGNDDNSSASSSSCSTSSSSTSSTITPPRHYFLKEKYDSYTPVRPLPRHPEDPKMISAMSAMIEAGKCVLKDVHEGLLFQSDEVDYDKE
jgi:thiazolylpeptide-type bacteriocin precursor